MRGCIVRDSQTGIARRVGSESGAGPEQAGTFDFSLWGSELAGACKTAQAEARAVSNTYQAGAKLLAACGRLLLARPGGRNTNRAWGDRDQLDAQRIRINPKGMPESLAGVRFDRKRAARGGIGPRGLRAKTPCGNSGAAQSSSRKSAAFASAPPGQIVLHARFGSDSNFAFCNSNVCLSAAGISIPG
jgi:hypothetical protein